MIPCAPTHVAYYKGSQYPYQVAKWGPKLLVVFHEPDPWGEPAITITRRTHWVLEDRLFALSA
jgi:hypothetical protein